MTPHLLLLWCSLYTADGNPIWPPECTQETAFYVLDTHIEAAEDCGLALRTWLFNGGTASVNDGEMLAMVCEVRK